jgi:hypothetical protein
MGRSLLLAWMLLAGLPPGWSSLPAPPVAREWAVEVWTGQELVLWGGRSDGVAYDARSRRWRRVPPPPLSARHSATGVWTGREVLVWGGMGRRRRGDGAALDPSTNSWRRLPPGPLSPREPAASVWTGRELIVWGDASRASAARDGAAFDPVRWTWRRLPPAPLPMNEVSAEWTGRELIVLGALLNGRNFAPYRWARALAYNPTRDRWHRLPPVRITPQASSIGWTGRELVAWGYGLGAAVYLPAANRWRRLPDLPLRPQECYPKTAAVGGWLLAWYCGRSALYDPSARRWRSLAPLPRALSIALRGPVAAGEMALFPTTSGLWAYRPPAQAAP